MNKKLDELSVTELQEVVKNLSTLNEELVETNEELYDIVRTINTEFYERGVVVVNNDYELAFEELHKGFYEELHNEMFGECDRLTSKNAADTDESDEDFLCDDCQAAQDLLDSEQMFKAVKLHEKKEK
jgi:hypothetical protein